MSVFKVRAALEKRLAALDPDNEPFPTAYQAFGFAPVNGVPYQRAWVIPAKPDNSVQGSRVHWQQGIFQVTLFYPDGEGTAAVEARVDQLMAHFKRGTTMVEDGIAVIVVDTPEAAAGAPDGDRYAVPVSIRYQAQIGT